MKVIYLMLFRLVLILKSKPPHFQMVAQPVLQSVQNFVWKLYNLNNGFGVYLIQTLFAKHGVTSLTTFQA